MSEQLPIPAEDYRTELKTVLAEIEDMVLVFDHLIFPKLNNLIYRLAILKPPRQRE